MRNVRRSPLHALALGLVAVVGVGACTSQPSAKAVAEDVVESLDGLTDTERACMLEKIEGYSEDEINAIGEESAAVDFAQPNAIETSNIPSLQAWFEDLNSCMSAS